jgi:NTP pyrophosphatase (non-canonical NTP hydrolase)
LNGLNEYQIEARKTGDYPQMGGNLIYPALGLSGEAGETVDKIKKLWRNKGITRGTVLDAADRTALIKELGDVLWYTAAIASELGTTLSFVAAENIRKLHDRANRGVIKSEGDDR